jgi:hypothetical protein
MMHEPEKSDSAIVAAKPANKPDNRRRRGSSGSVRGTVSNDRYREHET